MDSYINREKLLNRLPLIFSLIKTEEEAILILKWGINDNLYHSAKYVKKNIETAFSEDGIKKIEANAISLIERVLNDIFLCDNCKCDLRKSGLLRYTTGDMRSNIYISADGYISRENHERFNPRNFSKDIPVTVYKCHDCEHTISRTNLLRILEMGLNRDSVNIICEDNSINVSEYINTLVKYIDKVNSKKDKKNTLSKKEIISRMINTGFNTGLYSDDANKPEPEAVPIPETPEQRF